MIYDYPESQWGGPTPWVPQFEQTPLVAELMQRFLCRRYIDKGDFQLVDGKRHTYVPAPELGTTFH